MGADIHKEACSAAIWMRVTKLPMLGVVELNVAIGWLALPRTRYSPQSAIKTRPRSEGPASRPTC